MSAYFTSRSLTRRSYTWLDISLLLAAFVWTSSISGAEDKNPGASGTWKWSFTTQDGQTIGPVLKLKQEGDKLTGVYLGRGGTETKIEQGAVKEGEISFKVTRERNGQTFTAKYKGKVSGDAIKGTIETDFGGQNRSRDWEAKRAKETASTTGKWQWSLTTQDGQTFELNLKLKQEGEKITGALIWGNGTEMPITEGNIKDSEVFLKIISERDGRTVTSKYKGKLDGDTIKGQRESDWSGQNRTSDWLAKRVSKEN